MTTRPEKSSTYIFEKLLALLPDIIESLDRLKLDFSGRAPFKIRAREAEPQDSYVGTLGTTTKLYRTCMEKYGTTHDVVFYGYDWRKSVSETADQLKMFIDLREYEKVTFVCHSMGGVVASYYLADNENDLEKVERVITMGTPFGGSPKALLTLEKGEFLDFRFAPLDKTIKELSRDYPSVYELLPYDQLIDHDGAYIRQRLSDNVEEMLNREETEYYISNKGSVLNQSMFKNALDIQNKIYQTGEHILNSAEIDTHIIAGYGIETLMEIEINGEEIKDTRRDKRGDGTVPLISATQTNGKFFNKPIYFVNGVKHGSLPEDNNLIDLVCQIIDHGQAVMPKGDHIKVRTNENTIEDVISKTFKTTKSTNKVTAFCPVMLVLVNEQDEILGLASSLGIFADDEYEAYFELFDDGETKQVDVPPGCSVKIIGEGEGKMDLMMSTFAPDGDLLKRSHFRDIDVSDRMLANVEITDAADVTIEIDFDGDNAYDKTLTGKDGEIFVKSVEVEKSDKDYHFWIVIGFSGFIVLGTALSLLIISIKYSIKKRKSKKNKE